METNDKITITTEWSVGEAFERDENGRINSITVEVTDSEQGYVTAWMGPNEEFEGQRISQAEVNYAVNFILSNGYSDEGVDTEDLDYQDRMDSVMEDVLLAFHKIWATKNQETIQFPVEGSEAFDYETETEADATPSV